MGARELFVGGASVRGGLTAPVDPAQAARAQGDFLLVGIHSDEDVAKRRGQVMAALRRKRRPPVL